jgi:hypothetical protein
MPAFCSRRQPQLPIRSQSRWGSELGAGLVEQRRGFKNSPQSCLETASAADLTGLAANLGLMRSTPLRVQRVMRIHE